MTEESRSSDDGMAQGIPVSVLILTLNEETNIARCIQALDWSNDVVVLDSVSSDATQDIAKNLGARVFERAFDDFASQRNYALDNIEFRHSWVLHLDADEVVMPDLCSEISLVIKRSSYKAFRIPSKLMFHGKWLRFSGMYPCYQVRLGHRDHLRFKQVGHGQRENLPVEEVGTLVHPYLHFGFSKGIEDWIERHNRYSTDEAKLALAADHSESVGWWELFTLSDKTELRRALKEKAANLPLRPQLRFFYMYLLKMGILDGRAGFTYCRLLAMYEYWTVLKIRELKVETDET